MYSNGYKPLTIPIDPLPAEMEAHLGGLLHCCNSCFEPWKSSKGLTALVQNAVTVLLASTVSTDSTGGLPPVLWVTMSRYKIPEAFGSSIAFAGSVEEVLSVFTRRALNPPRLLLTSAQRPRGWSHHGYLPQRCDPATKGRPGRSPCQYLGLAELGSQFMVVSKLIAPKC
jgi:hypothetical protein